VPTDEEITALLALPEGAREALKGCDGPGWTVCRQWARHCRHEPFDDPVVWSEVEMSSEGVEWFERLEPFEGKLPRNERQRIERTWLPCNPLEIVRVAAGRYGGRHHAYVGLESRTCGVAKIGHEECFTRATPHLAALALLAEVFDEQA